MASSPQSRLAAFLKANGRRFTGQMVYVLDTALKLSGLFTRDDIIEETRGVVSRVTVYRTLTCMVEADVLRQVQFNGYSVYVAVAVED